jgi:hypothetical protein
MGVYVNSQPRTARIRVVKLWLFRLGVGYERFNWTSEARVFARYVFR